MKPRHAAALAFVVWYLMTPPPPFDPSTPLSKWTRMGKTDYASEGECTAVREKLQVAFRDPGDIPPEHITATIMVKAMAHLLCVESDDPRLKGN